MAALRAHGGRARAARAHVPPARRDAQGAGQAPDGAQGRVLRAVGHDRRHARPTAGSTSTAASARSSPTPAAVVASFPTRRSTSRGPASRSRSAARSSGRHICVPLEGVAIHINAFNFPVLGDDGEAGAGAAGRRAVHREAGHGHELPHRGGVPVDHRGGHPAGRCACSSSAAAPATCSTHVTEQDAVAFTGFGGHGADAQGKPRDRGAFGALQHGSGLAQLLHPGSGCRAGHRRVRAVHQGSRARDDDEGGPEMHGHSPHDRAGRHGRGRGEGAARAPRDDHHR